MAKARKIILKEDELKDSKESSLLFHNIIKASVNIKPKAKKKKKSD